MTSFSHHDITRPIGAGSSARSLDAAAPINRRIRSAPILRSPRRVDQPRCRCGHRTAGRRRRPGRSPDARIRRASRSVARRLCWTGASGTSARMRNIPAPSETCSPSTVAAAPRYSTSCQRRVAGAGSTRRRRTRITCLAACRRRTAARRSPARRPPSRTALRPARPARRSRSTALKAPKADVAPELVLQAPPGREDRPADDQERGEGEQQRGRRPVGHLRGAGERDPPAGDRLLDRLDHPGQVHRQQDQVEAVDPEDVHPLVAATLQVRGHRGEVRQRGQQHQRAEQPVVERVHQQQHQCRRCSSRSRRDS